MLLGGVQGWGNLGYLSATEAGVSGRKLARDVTADNPVTLVKCDAGKTNCRFREVDAKDIKANGGQINVFNNGIFTTADSAKILAQKQISEQSLENGAYIIYNRYTGSPISEVPYVVYDAINTWMRNPLPSTSAEKTNTRLINESDKDTLYQSYSHSRGGFTEQAGLAGAEGKANIGEIYLAGSAAHATTVAKLVKKITGGDKNFVMQSTQVMDPIVVIGQNPKTGGDTAVGPLAAHNGYSNGPISKDFLYTIFDDYTYQAWPEGESKYEKVYADKKDKDKAEADKKEGK